MSTAYVQWPRRDAPGLNDVRLPDQGSVLIGRRQEASIRIEGDSAVSREHAELSCVEGAWLIADLGSTGGTYLMRDGTRRKLIGRHRLRHGDRISVGGTIVRFHHPPDAQDGVATDLAEAEIDTLTPRERELLTALCADELSGRGGWPDNATLARSLYISTDTVRSHLKSLYRKFGLDGVPDSQRKSRLVRRAIAEGWAGGEG